MFEQNFKNRFIKYIEKIMIIKKILHRYLIVYHFNYDEIGFRFYKRIFQYKRLRLFLLFDAFEFVMINYAQIDVITRNFIEKRKISNTVNIVIFKKFNLIFIVRFIEKSSSNRLRRSVNVKILIY